MISLNQNKGLYILFLALLSATPPLATDMYIGAIPIIADEMGVGHHLVNLSLILWFGSFSIALLVYGPLSDKFGRKPILLFGLSLFVLSSFLCGMSTGVWQLILFRILQGIGAAAPSAMVIAICRDKYNGEERRRALAYIGTILAVAPMVAPMIGAVLLGFGSWRYIFFTQAVLITGTFLISFAFKETIADKFACAWYKVFLRFGTVLKNKKFMGSNLSLSLVTGPLYGFIAFSPIFYIGMHNFTEKEFGLFFGMNASGAMLGAFACTFLLKYFKPNKLITVCLVGALFAVLGLLFFSHLDWHFFTLFAFIMTFFICMSRPLCTNLIVEQVSTDIGSASSFMVFTQLMFGAICMFFVSGAYSDPLLMYCLLAVGVTSFVVISWLYLKKFLA